MLTCKQVSRLVASGDLAGHSVFHRLQVRIHLLGCDHCKRYARELQAIGAAARRLLADEPLDPDRMERLKREILARAREGDKAP